MSQMTIRCFLATVALMPTLCFAQSPQAEMTQPQVVQFRDCVSAHFQKEVRRKPDKREVFSIAFERCQKEEENALNALRSKNASNNDFERVGVLLRKNIEASLLLALNEHNDDMLRRAAYIAELGSCQGADIQTVTATRNGLIDEIYGADRELRHNNLLALQVEYYRIIIRVNLSAIDKQQWCQEQKAVLQKGFAQGQTPLKFFAD